MLRNYLKVALRNLFRERSYALINILGLSVGLCVSLLILLWVQSETQMDRFYKDSDRTYRVLANVNSGESGISTWESVPYPMINYLKENYPDFEQVAGYNPTNKKQFKLGTETFLEDGIYATASFFEILPFPFLAGEVASAFNTLKAVTISEKLALKMFGADWKEKVMGQSLEINSEPGYIITGVFADPPDNSSLQFDFVLGLDALYANNNDNFPWGNFNDRLLLKLRENADIPALESKITAALHQNNEYTRNIQLVTQPYGRAYLHGRFEEGREAGGRILYVRLFTAAALFLLLIACVNFMNLATARASRRAKEVGVRKAVGAGKRSLISQFMLEAGLITVVSLLFALALGRLLLPYFQEITGKELVFQFDSPGFWALLLGVGVVTTILAGSYPAFFLSSFKITNVLKGRLAYHFAGNQLRRSLVVFQFALSALLIVGAYGVQQQVQFIKNKNLGLDKQNVMYFRTPPAVDEQMSTFREELLRVPGIEQLTFSSSNPLEVGSQTGDPSWEGMPAGSDQLFRVMSADHNFVSTMNIPLVKGRDFSAELRSDTVSYLINETAARVMKLEEPIGKKVEFWDMGGPIVGVVKDFHISSLYESIGPLIIVHRPQRTRLTMMRVDPAQTASVIASTESVFKRFGEGYPFRYDFLDARFFQRYESEQRTSQLARWFAIVALFVSCLGLLGLSAFTAELRTKEISIRKILGASVSNIVRMLSKDFIRLVGIALLIALPLSWYLLKQWLSGFAYHIDLTWSIFALAGGIAIAVALLTVSYQSFKAAVANPAESLRQE